MPDRKPWWMNGQEQYEWGRDDPFPAPEDTTAAQQGAPIDNNDIGGANA